MGIREDLLAGVEIKESKSMFEFIKEILVTVYGFAGGVVLFMLALALVFVGIYSIHKELTSLFEQQKIIAFCNKFNLAISKTKNILFYFLSFILIVIPIPNKSFAYVINFMYNYFTNVLYLIGVIWEFILGVTIISAILYLFLLIIIKIIEIIPFLNHISILINEQYNTICIILFISVIIYNIVLFRERFTLPY